MDQGIVCNNNNNSSGISSSSNNNNNNNNNNNIVLILQITLTKINTFYCYLGQDNHIITLTLAKAIFTN